VRPGGVVIVNTSLITRLPRRTDFLTVPVAANELAIAAGSGKAANMVALGAYLGASGIADLELVKGIVADTFAQKPKMVGVNHEALARGYAIGVEKKTASAVH